jgi:hypothetical protein
MPEKRRRFAERVKSAVDLWRDDLVARVRHDEGFSLLVQKHWLLLVAEKMDDHGKIVEDQIDPDEDAKSMVTAGLRAIAETDERLHERPARRSHK